MHSNSTNRFINIHSLIYKQKQIRITVQNPKTKFTYNQSKQVNSRAKNEINISIKIGLEMHCFPSVGHFLLLLYIE